MNPQAVVKPQIKKLRGSHFPPITFRSSYGYVVETVAGQVLYEGYSVHVARLVNACMMPRQY